MARNIQKITVLALLVTVFLFNNCSEAPPASQAQLKSTVPSESVTCTTLPFNPALLDFYNGSDVSINNLNLTTRVGQIHIGANVCNSFTLTQAEIDSIKAQIVSNQVTACNSNSANANVGQGTLRLRDATEFLEFISIAPSPSTLTMPGAWEQFLIKINNIIARAAAETSNCTMQPAPPTPAPAPAPAPTPTPTPTPAPTPNPDPIDPCLSRLGSRYVVLCP